MRRHTSPFELFWSEAALRHAGGAWGQVRERVLEAVVDIIRETSGARFETSAMSDAEDVFFCTASRRRGRWTVRVRRGRWTPGPLVADDAHEALRGKRLMLPAPDERTPTWIRDAAAAARLLS